jgi:two-component system CheB/CheR fusion protein
VAAGNFGIVGVGASAGGLDACRKLLTAIPSDTGLAFILVQHLDPSHESLMVDLLAGETSMVVVQATDGMPIQPNHVYTIPPGTYLSVSNDTLQVSPPDPRHGARLPFDFLLRSLAEQYGDRAICVILSGTGGDGSIGLKAIRQHGGLVIAQDPDEAGYDGMPRSAIETGEVDLILPIAKIPSSLHRLPGTGVDRGGDEKKLADQTDWLGEIIDLLRTRTSHNFTLYKHGTLERRIERRMGMAGVATDDKRRYLETLRSDPAQLEILAKDLLINVTSFFRDRKVFDLLETKIIPDLVRNHLPDQPLRIWIAGCSTGEEAYSLAMLFREQISETKGSITLQVFASDIHADVVAAARTGFYPKSIEADVSTGRLNRFFAKEETGYRVLPDLRAAVVFTVHDVLVDPPFSRMDMVSCRNLLIYLNPEAQSKVVFLFHFALRKDGILLLGGAETTGNIKGRFDVISKSARLYRRVGQTPQADFGFLIGSETVRVPPRVASAGQPAVHQTTLSNLCRRLVTDAYAPAAIMINRHHEVLYSLGPTDHYLRVAPGHPTHDLLAMVPQDMRSKLRTAIQQASKAQACVTIRGGKTRHDGMAVSFSIDVRPVVDQGEPLLLICFIDQPKSEAGSGYRISHHERPRVAELEQELEATKTELHGAIRNLEISSEEQKAINEEALSVNEEYQSTNEELVTSKEELQSLNEELTALNGQLQETLERQRTTANDLQNVLYSTDVATIFLDTGLKIRFFTPATKSVFNVIPGDIGRPLADLSLLAVDADLLADAKAILTTHAIIEREIEGQNGAWYIRRILPYRTQSKGVEGVVITFADITERRHVSDVLETARREAESATAMKSRFLAAASHDLRQPLQTLTLLQGLLADCVEGQKARKLVARIESILSAMSGMLNTLLDINQIEVGTIRPEVVDFPIDNLLNGLREEFTYPAHAKDLSLRVISCGLVIRSDPRLLEQMIRNLLSNAVKYTSCGEVLLGCRRRKGMLSIEIWDTGIGIPQEEFQAIFEEYYQLDNAARERSRGLGLGLSIVKRLGDLLGHQVHVRSITGKGSVFAIDVPFPAPSVAHDIDKQGSEIVQNETPAKRGLSSILTIEDDPDTREFLELALKAEGYEVASTSDGPATLALLAKAVFRPDLVLADYNLPNGMSGLEIIDHIRETRGASLPAVVLTGDISTTLLGEIESRHCAQLSKPVKSKDLAQVIRKLLETAPAPSKVQQDAAARPGLLPISIVDDDGQVREAMRSVLEGNGWAVHEFASAEAFLAAYHPGYETCLLIDATLPGMSGVEVLQHLDAKKNRVSAIMITGHGDVPTAVKAMTAGAFDFIEKPVASAELIASIDRALERSHDSDKQFALREAATGHLATLTSRQRQIMEMVLAGHPSKNIAADLGISQRTVENHRASIMKKTGAKSLPALARLAQTAVWNNPMDILV